MLTTSSKTRNRHNVYSHQPTGVARNALKKNESGPKQLSGIIVQNESEGEFLDRTRAYGLYIYRAKLTPSLMLNTGAAFGTFGYSVKGSNTSAGGSATTLDGKFGASVSSSRWTSGISINQLFNNTLIPFSTPIRLKRYYSFYGKYTQRIRTEDLNFYCHVDYFQKNLKATLNVTIGLLKHLEIGSGYRLQEGMSFMGGLKKIPLKEKSLKIGFAYWIPLHKRLSSNRSAEFCLVLE